MLIAQISDLHFLPPGILAFGKVDVAGCLERAIAHLNQLYPAPELVLITGDLTNDGDEPAYHLLAATLERLRLPYFPLIGNHDPREAPRRALRLTSSFPCRGTRRGPGLSLPHMADTQSSDARNPRGEDRSRGSLCGRARSISVRPS